MFVHPIRVSTLYGNCVLFFSIFTMVMTKDCKMSETTEFSNIVRNPGFIDKTLLIREILENNKTSVITAPPLFGKSTNIDMIKKFFEIEVDENGTPKTKANFLSEAVKDTDNYKLFQNNRLKINDDVTLMDAYLGRTPVLSISFKCETEIKEASDILKYFQQVVHHAFKKYFYLVKSGQLENSYKQIIESWCDKNEYLTFDEQRVLTALRELAEFIYRHFHQQRVFVLIDEYDFVIRNAIYSAMDDDVLKTVIQFSARMTDTLLKRNGRYVQGGLMTGILDIPAFGSPPHNSKAPDSFQIYRFLGDHRFDKYYGATTQEAEELIRNYQLKYDIDQVAERYNGYLSRNRTKIYNLYSLVNFAKSGEMKNYWISCGTKRNVTDLIHFTYVQKNITELLKNESVYVEAMEKVTVDDFIQIRNIMTIQSFQLLDISRAFFILFVEGYLTYKSGIIIQIDKETPKVGVRCPNNEIKEFFEKSINPS